MFLNHVTHLKTLINPFGKLNLSFLQRKQGNQAVVGHEVCSSQTYASLKNQ